MNQILPELSIIIPAFNEEKRLGSTLTRIREYFEAHPIAGGIEIIVVDDGSTDGTAGLVEEWSRQVLCVRLLSNGENRGKGYSVRHGML
ncbi:MAG TPA: glycosyltransferase, partial [Acidisoma sp.]|nr:glycosyltransferase [Acidisoma sp.]